MDEYGREKCMAGREADRQPRAWERGWGDGDADVKRARTKDVQMAGAGISTRAYMSGAASCIARGREKRDPSARGQSPARERRTRLISRRRARRVWSSWPARRFPRPHSASAPLYLDTGRPRSDLALVRPRVLRSLEKSQPPSLLGYTQPPPERQPNRFPRHPRTRATVRTWCASCVRGTSGIARSREARKSRPRS